jgi:hypothetical protein
MNSYLTEDFIASFRNLPHIVKQQAKKNYRLWKADRTHPSLHFKPVHTKEAIYSVRVGKGWRALGLVENDSITWFWIGSHSDYDKLLSQL